MTTHRSWIALLFVLLAPVAAGQDVASIRVESLRIDHTDRPLGLHDAPRFSWTLASDERDQIQRAYQVVVYATKDAKETMWDSGKVRSDQSAHVPYGGPPLKPRARYYWTVRVWDARDRPTAFAALDWWEMGLVEPDDWSATWISASPPEETLLHPDPAPMFRTEFATTGDIARARLYISGLGYHEAFLNGRKVGDHVLDPAATRYDKRVMYVVHDVTSLVRTGENALGVMLGNGWYNQHTRSAWDFDQAPWRAPPALLAQLEVTYADGTSEIITTDDRWRVSAGPITFDGIRNGEHYDARLEMPGWTEPGFDASGWSHPHVVSGPTGILSPQLMPPIRVIGTRYPVRVDQPTDSSYVYDFGQNLTGWVRLRVRGPRGAEVTIRYGERIFADGTLDQRELSRFVWSGETQTDRYVLKGGETEEWHPRFVYHGFQYAEITPSTEDVHLELVSAEVVHTDLRPAGSFETSNPLINQIHRNLLWSYLGNYHGYPTDCPHREKIGWSGDAHLAAHAGLYNFDVAQSYLKWIDDFADEQRESGQVPGIIPTSGWGYTFGRDERYRNRGYGPAWESAYVLIPWYVYLHTGDEAILERHYDGLREYVDYLHEHAEDGVIRFGIDDHKPAFTATDPPILQTGHYYESTRVVAEMARIIGKPAEDLERRLQHIRRAFHESFFNGETYGNGGQTSLAAALYHDLAPDHLRADILKQLLDDVSRRGGHIDAGVVGTRYVLKGLDDAGRNDVAYRMATQTDYPGWGHWISKGATTLWQDWKGSMSLNHVMFGSIGEWFYEALAGIRYDPENPGFKQSIVRPAFPEGLEWVRASHATPYGTVRSSWRRAENLLSLAVEVPVNTSALIVLPGGRRVLERGLPVEQIPDVDIVFQDESETRLRVGSGSYAFTLPDRP